MLLQLLFIIVGIVLVLRGADCMTEGAVGLARRFHVSEMVIGLTIVAAGTSAPELFVSVVSALNGTTDMAVGNVLGSNTMNALLIVGVAALVAPMIISRTTVNKDIPFAVAASLLLLVLCLDRRLSASIAGNHISRIDGVLLLAGFAVFMAYTFRSARKGVVDNTEDKDVEDVVPMSAWRGVFFVVLGLACLVVGANVFVNAASQVAQQLGVSDGVIGLTIVAGGTSLPELATSVVAARKGQSAIAIGNVIGSNVFNILLILGVTAVISPMQIEGITAIDLLIMLVSVAMVWLFSATKLTVARWEGAVLVLVYVGYLAWLLSNL